MTSETGNLRQILDSDRKVVFVEFTPPPTADVGVVRQAAATLRGHADAVSVVDNRHGIAMSAIATASILRAEGVEPIVHMTTRDRNRIALLSDVLGAQALGLSSLLCTSGDHQTLGPDKAARNVYDLDTVQFLATLDRLRRDGVLPGDGRQVEPRPMCLGAVASPQADPRELQAMRLAKKVEAGADFFITHPVFDAGEFAKWLEALAPWGLPGKAAMIVGVLAPPTAAKAREMRARMPGAELPDPVLARLQGVGEERQKDEAIAIAVEIIGRLKTNNGVKGFCLMTDGDYDTAVKIIQQTGLMRR